MFRRAFTVAAQMPTRTIGVTRQAQVRFASSGGSITEAEVHELQSNWANAIKTISSTFLNKGDYVATAGDAAAELYGYGHSNVLFKPTKAAKVPFRPTGTDAMSYFVGGNVIEGVRQFNGSESCSDLVFEGPRRRWRFCYQWRQGMEGSGVQEPPN